MTITITTTMNALELSNLCKGKPASAIREILKKNAYSFKEISSEDTPMTIFIAKVMPSPARLERIKTTERGVISYKLSEIFLKTLS